MRRRMAAHAATSIAFLSLDAESADNQSQCPEVSSQPEQVDKPLHNTALQTSGACRGLMRSQPWPRTLFCTATDSLIIDNVSCLDLLHKTL